MRASATLLAVLLLVGGCTPKYKYNNVSYGTREAAVAAAREDLRLRESEVPEASSRIGGSVLIVVPTREVIRKNGVRITGTPSEDQVGYVVDVLELGFRTRAEVVMKGKVFDQTTMIEASDVEAYQATEYDYKLWLLGNGPAQWQWYLSKSGSSMKEPVTADLGLTGSQRAASFNAAIVKAATTLGTSSAARPSPWNQNTPANTPTPSPTPAASVAPPQPKNTSVDNVRPPAPSAQSVPMQKAGGTYVVPVLVNNAITLDFVVDSGSADVSIPADVVLTLMRTGTIKKTDFLGTKTYTLADGSTVPSSTFRIRSLKVGDRVVENVTGSLADVRGSLLLGQSFLGRFKSWSIDNARHVLMLE